MSTSGERSTRDRAFGGSAPRALLILAVFWIAARMQEAAVRVPGYAELYERHPFYVPEGIRSLVEIALVVGVVMAMHRLGVTGASRELGVGRRPWQGLVFGMLAALPMWAVFAATVPPARAVDPWAVLYLAGLSPLAEEAVFRAFAFGQLRRLGWGFWWAVLVPAAVFGLVHVRADQSPAERAGVFLITAVGGLLFAFVYERWDRSLWAPFSLHAAMNLAWQLFAVGESAVAGWLPTALQAAVAFAAVALTLWRSRLPLLARSGTEGAREPTSGGSPDGGP